MSLEDDAAARKGCGHLRDHLGISPSSALESKKHRKDQQRAPASNAVIEETALNTSVANMTLPQNHWPIMDPDSIPLIKPVVTSEEALHPPKISSDERDN